MSATMEETQYGTAVTGFVIWTTKKAAVQYAKAHGWMVQDVRPAYHKHFGHKGYIVGQFIDTETFRGFAKNDTFVEAKCVKRFA